MADVAKEPIVVLSYAELTGPTTPELAAKIAEAYSYSGLGILAISGVPGFAEKRQACLPYAYKFGMLTDDVKAKYEHAASTYSFGWSHGKEKLEGRADTAKGSYYFNPTHDRPVEDESLIAQYPAFLHPNIWPAEEDCPGFKEACKGLGQLIVDTGALLARHVDAHVLSKLPAFGKAPGGAPAATTSGAAATAEAATPSPLLLEHIVRSSRVAKARLLLYFPTDTGKTAESASGSDDGSTWCGAHNDHGSLTGLAPAMYIDASGKEIPCPDPKAGLYIRSRQGKTVRVSVPSDCIAFQIGETSQVHSGGVLQATPHWVRAAEGAPGVSRATLAVFMEPEWDCPMATPTGADAEEVLRGARGELLPKGVPPLVSRWKGAEQTFGQFTDVTLASYY